MGCVSNGLMKDVFLELTNMMVLSRYILAVKST